MWKLADFLRLEEDGAEILGISKYLKFSEKVPLRRELQTEKIL